MLHRTVGGRSRACRGVRPAGKSDYHGPANGLAADGGLEDSGVGFSAKLAFGMASGAGEMTAAAARPQSVTLASVGVMIGKPDPDMMFPTQVRFHPYLVLRNVTSTPKTVSVSANYMPSSAPATAHLLDVTLPAYATRTVDAEGAIQKLGLHPLVGYVNLVYSFTGQQTDVLISAGSVDGGGNYVFEVPAVPSIRSAWRDICRWQVGDGTDTMLTVWNHAASAQDLVLTLFFDGGSYKLPLHLEANASRMLNIGDVIAKGQPDVDGNMIPLGTVEGSAKLSGTKSEVEWIEVSASASSYNVNKATCHPYCVNCNGTAWNQFWVNPDFWDYAVGQRGQLTAIGQSTSGTQYNLTANGTWKSANTQIATVGTGSSSPGLVTGVLPGSPGTTFTYIIQLPITMCGDPPNCPGPGTDTIQATGYVQTPIQHNYPNKPFSFACWISTFYDAARPTGSHHADDVTQSDGNGQHSAPALGTPVYAMEAGTVKVVVTGQPNAPYPACLSQSPRPPGDYAKILGVDGYSTIYFHMTPSVVVNQPVTAGQQIGVLDSSGCQSAPHLHVGRKDSNNNPVNFTIPCDNPLPGPPKGFDDGTIYDNVPDTL